MRILEDTEYLEYKITLSTKPLTEVTHASSQYKNNKQSISGFGLQLENDERDHKVGVEEEELGKTQK